MTFTREYREFCKATYGRAFTHSPTAGGSSEGEKWEDIYGQTLEFYEEVFEEAAPEHIWEPSEERFDETNFNFKNINLYRLAVLYSMRTVNEDFLAAPVQKSSKKSGGKVKINKANKTLVKRHIRKHLRNKKGGNRKKKGWRRHYRHFRKNGGGYDDNSSNSLHSHDSEGSGEGHDGAICGD